MDGAHFLRDTRYPIPENLGATGGVRLLGSSQRVPIDRFVDLSAAGLRFICKAQLADKTDVDVLIHLSGYKLKFIGQVIRITAMEGGQYDLFVGFQTISQANLKKLFSLVKT